MRVWLTFAALIFLAIRVSGCASVPEKYWQVNRMTSDRFTYVSDVAKHGVPHYDEPLVTGNNRFSGDCEEYASAIQFQLAKIGVSSTRWYVVNRAGPHALTCTATGWCFDANTVPFRREKAPYIFITTLDR